METRSKTNLIIFREKQQEGFSEWSQELGDLECLRNYLKTKRIGRISLRTFLSPLNKFITIKSYVTPQQLTSDNYLWLIDYSENEARFISIINKTS
jgi:hypothetical protein